MTTTDSQLQVVVVGGGPAGAATALSLAQQGHAVTLYEAYPHPLKVAKNSPKAYVISLGKRGQEGLQAATGITPEAVCHGIMSTNFVRQSVKRPTLQQRPFASLVAPRKVLTSHILDRAAEAGVHIHYQHALVDIDFDKREITLEDKTDNSTSPKKKRATYDLLVGADGAKSVVRTLLHERATDFNVLRTLQDTMEYQVAVLPASPFANQYPTDTVYTWNNRTLNSICLGFPLVTGELLFALVFPQGKFTEYKKMGFDEPLDALFQNLDAAAKQDLAVKFAAGQAANGGYCVWTDSLGSVQHGVALVGDSGHAMWPSLGQGANCALESTAVFCQACRRVVGQAVSSNNSVTTSSPTKLASEIVHEFNTQRHADAMAAVDLTFGGIGARTSRGRQNAPLSYKLQVLGIMLLHKTTLGLVPKPALLRLMEGGKASYSSLHKYNFVYERVICLSGLAVICVPVFIGWMKRR